MDLVEELPAGQTDVQPSWRLEWGDIVMVAREGARQQNIFSTESKFLDLSLLQLFIGAIDWRIGYATITRHPAHKQNPWS